MAFGHKDPSLLSFGGPKPPTLHTALCAASPLLDYGFGLGTRVWNPGLKIGILDFGLEIGIRIGDLDWE